MHRKTLKGNLILLLTAAIWGLAFVAQRSGMKYIGAFTYNGVRFMLGSISLIPLILYFNSIKNMENNKIKFRNSLLPGIISGVVLFLASSFQQVGLIETSAGKAAFITGLYIVLVPIFGIFLKHSNSINTWLGTAAATAGLYFLCVTDQFTIAFSDLFVLACAFLFAVHILLIDSYSTKFDVLKLAFFQFLTCSLLSMVTAVLFESITLKGIQQAAVPILYGGIFSVGIAYTLQIFGQKNAKPAHAAIILSMESVFAAVGGFLILNEQLGLKELSGCVLMFSGILLSQIKMPKEIGRFLTCIFQKND